MDKGKTIYYVNDRGTERLIKADSKKAALAFVCNEIAGCKAEAGDVARVLEKGGRVEDAQ